MDTLPSCADNGNSPLKRCSACSEGQQWHPATLEYFPPEKKGKNGLSSRCRVCARAKQKRYRSKPEKHQHHVAYMKEYHSRPEVQEQQYAYNRRPDRLALMCFHQKAYRARPGVRERLQEYYQRPEVVERITAFYSQPEQRTAKRNRRARRRNAPGAHTAQQIQEQYTRQKGKCYYCRNKVVWGKHHVDHVVPITRGGSNDISNIVIACPLCNLRKNKRLPHEFYEGGRLL